MAVVAVAVELVADVDRRERLVNEDEREESEGD